MPLLQTDVAAGSQAWTNIQRNQLEQQYMPQHFAEQMTREIQTNQLQRANIEKLQSLTSGDKTAQTALSEIYGNPANKDLPQSKKLAMALDKIAASGGAPTAIMEGLSTMVDKADLHESQTLERQSKTKALVRQEQLSILDGTDWSDPQAVNTAVLNAQQKGVLPQGFTQLLAKVGPQKAKEMALNSLKTEEQKDRDLKMITEKVKIEENQRLAREKLETDRAYKESQQAILRDNLDIKREAAADRKVSAEDRRAAKIKDQEETARRNRETSDRKIDRDITIIQGKANSDPQLNRLLDKIELAKAETHFFNEEEKRTAAVEPLQKQYDMLFEKKYGPTLRNLNSKLSPESKRTDIPEAPVTKTKPITDPSVVDAATKAWGSYDPTKYDYKVIDGKLARKEKGK